MYKKLTSVFLIICLSVAFCGNIFATEKIDTQTKALQELRDYYSKTLSESEYAIAERFLEAYENDEVFLNHLQKDKDDAINMVRSVIDNIAISKVEPKYAIYQGVRAPVPSIRQPWNNSCGPTSTLQVLKSFGFSYTHDKIAASMGVTQNGSFTPSADAIMEILNRDNLGYKYVPASALTKDEFRKIVITSLAVDGPIILQTQPKYLPYYPSTSTTGHYIVAQEFNMATNTFELNDCHYDDRYFGLHYVSLQEAYDSVHNYSRGHVIYTE